MKLTRSTNYGIIAVCYIAQADEGANSQEIAGKYGIPLEYLLKILQDLVRANILTSKRGPGGGFKLAKSPSQINLLQVIEALQGTISEELQLDHTSAAGKDKVVNKTQREFKKVIKQTKASLKKIKVSNLL